MARARTRTLREPIDGEKLMRIIRQKYPEKNKTQIALDLGYYSVSTFSKRLNEGWLDIGDVSSIQTNYGITLDEIRPDKPKEEKSKEEPKPEPITIDYDELAEAIWKRAPKIDLADAIIKAMTSNDTARLWRMVAKAVEDGTKSGIKEARKERAQYQAKEN